MKSCPLCRRPLRGAGLIAQGQDDAGCPYLIAICDQCARRLVKLPTPRRVRQITAALNVVLKSPDHFHHLAVADKAEAAVLCGMAGDRDPAIAATVVDMIIAG